MKFLADVNVEKPVVDILVKLGHDVARMPDIDCMMEDEGVLALAVKEARILITNDKDFGELVFLQKKLSSGIILFRVKGQATQEKAHLIQRILKDHGSKLFGHFTTVTKDKVRFVPLEGAQ
jgi:predicted nuclease of predicted toxin-antitoxin system